MDYFSHLQAYTLPYTLNCICVSLFTIIVSLCNKIEHNNMNFLFSFCIKGNCKLQLTVSGSGGLLAVFHIELAPVRGLLTVWSPWGTQGLARCQKKSALGIGYIQQLKALLASCSGTKRFNGGLG